MTEPRNYKPGDRVRIKWRDIVAVIRHRVPAGWVCDWENGKGHGLYYENEIEPIHEAEAQR